MSDSVDYYDVQRMIRDERHLIDGHLNRELESLRSELRREIEELRSELASLNRVLQARTEQLV